MPRTSRFFALATFLIVAAGCVGESPSPDPSDGSVEVHREFAGFSATRVPVGVLPCDASDPVIEGDPSYFYVRVPSDTTRLSATLTWEETTVEMRLALGPQGAEPITGNSSTSGSITEIRESPEPGDWTISAAPNIAGAAVHWRIALVWTVPPNVTAEDTISDLPCS